MFKRRKRPREAEPVDAAALGWDSIDQAFAALHPGVQPVHRALAPPPRLGGILNGVSAYPSGDGWHFVTYGLTELFEKESDDPDRSGWGYELTLRTLPAEEPPAWAFDLIAAIARTTAVDGHVYETGHRIDTAAPIDGDHSALTAVALVEDRTAKPTALPFGHFVFLQVVGITAPELERMKATSTEAVLDEIATSDPLCRTDPARG